MRATDADWDRLAGAVRHRREELGFTQVQLAERAGVTDTTIGNLEGGRRFKRPPASLPAVEQALGWTKGSARAVLTGGEPALDAEPVPAVAHATEPAYALQPLSGQLPANILDELAASEVYATDIHDLSQAGGITIITVAVRRPGEPGEQISAEQRRRNFRAWDRVQRKLNGLPLPEWEPGDPEEWKVHSEENKE
jgi:transcriptional regulator with XRE-family HTH domain